MHFVVSSMNIAEHHSARQIIPCCNSQIVCMYVCMYITKYSSTLYIGMDKVLAHYACTFKNSDLHFHFQ